MLREEPRNLIPCEAGDWSPLDVASHYNAQPGWPDGPNALSCNSGVPDRIQRCLYVFGRDGQEE